MCRVHFIRNLMKVIPKKKWSDVVDAKALRERKGMARAVDMFDRFQDSLHSHAAFPKCHRRKLRTTNMLGAHKP